MKTSSSKIALTENAKLIRREYFKEWRKKNPEKVRATQKRYWEKKAQENYRQEMKKN